MTEGIYASANNLILNALKTELNLIVNEDKVLQSYDDARQSLAIIDQDINDSTKLWGIYDGAMLNATWDGGATWNREHVWPNSRLGMDRVDGYEKNQASDLHNLRASSVSINSSKSDRVFLDGSGVADITSYGFYPGDDHRGDVARIIFYMAITYDFLELIDDDTLLANEDDHYTLEGARMGKLSILLTWHKQDPISEFEIARNNRIASIQGNRNPFIDHPEFVHLIWENKTIGDLQKPVTTSYQHDIVMYIDFRKEHYDYLYA
jgi:endonuclease I